MPRRPRCPILTTRLLLPAAVVAVGLSVLPGCAAAPRSGQVGAHALEASLGPSPDAAELPALPSEDEAGAAAGKTEARQPAVAQAPARPVAKAEPEPVRRLFAGAARIIIPDAGVDAEVVDGTTPEHLARGPGVYPEGSLPHLGGNVAIAGHRTTYGAWFRHLDRLEKGDIIHLIYDGSMYRYEVERVWVIAYNDWSVIAPTGEHVLTLTTCHPPGSSAYRLAVRARWVETIDLNANAPL
ncbi:MAG TPA: sortase [Bacillota bacterium]